MAVISLAQYKTLLGITSTDATRDARITALVPLVEADIVEYCNNSFTNGEITFSGYFVPTVAAGPAYTLVCALGGISDVAFATGDTVLLEGTTRNDGRFTVSGLSDTVVTVDEALVAEASVSSSITLVDWPDGLRLHAARMIAYQMSRIDDPGVTSESIKSYSYSRGDGGTLAYPKEVLAGLDSWRFVRTARGTIRQQFDDRRGTWVGSPI